MVCTICGKHSHFCIGQAQSIHCAVMQHMTALGHRHVQPTLNNTQYPLSKHANRAQCWLSCRPCYKKVVFLPTEPTIGGGCLLSFRLALLLSLLSFQVRRHSQTLQYCAELHFDHQPVAHWSQFCCKAMSNFILICSLRFF